MRAIWKGSINFGLVANPVGLAAATESRSISFRQICRKDHASPGIALCGSLIPCGLCSSEAGAATLSAATRVVQASWAGSGVMRSEDRNRSSEVVSELLSGLWPCDD